MDIVCCQLDTVWEDRRASFARVRSLLDNTDIATNSLIVLPEMFATGFSMNVAAVAEDDTHETERFLAFAAVEYHAYVLGGLASLGPDGRGRNQAVAYSPMGKEIARYTKLHPFTFAGEQDHYAPGSRLESFDWRDVPVAPFICYDLRFPEAFRRSARRGAQVFAVIANWPEERQAHWVALLRARAIENQAYVVGVNRCGSDPAHAYGGRSLVIDPEGDIAADAGTREGVVTASLDIAALEEYRRRFPALGDIRPDLMPID